MRIEAQAPIIGSAFVGGMAQSWLIRKYPEYSWILSLGLIGGGVFLATKPGWMETIGLGLATAGASGLGTAIMPVGTTARGGIGQRMLAAAQARKAALGIPQLAAASRYPAPVREEEFEGVRLH